MTASHVDYDAASNEGSSVEETGDLTIADSTLHGTNAFDLISAYKAAAHVKVSYTTLTGAHCGLHIEPAESFEIDHVTSENNIFGITHLRLGQWPEHRDRLELRGHLRLARFPGRQRPDHLRWRLHEWRRSHARRACPHHQEQGDGALRGRETSLIDSEIRAYDEHALAGFWRGLVSFP